MRADLKTLSTPFRKELIMLTVYSISVTLDGLALLHYLEYGMY